MTVISGRTKVIGLFGQPLLHSPLPRLINEGLRTVPLPYALVPFPVGVPHVKEAVAAAKSLHLSGICVASPLKEAMMPYLDEAGATTLRTGSVDTVNSAGGRLIGHNTELWSFLEAVKGDQGFGLKGKRALLAGAGGTARSIATALLMEGVASLTLTNRTPARAEALAADLSKRLQGAPVSVVPFSPPEFRSALRESDLLLNAVPADLESSQGPLLGEKDLHPALSVFDASYQPTTPLLAMARRAGCPALSGSRMLLWRIFFGVRQWTGHEPSLPDLEEVMGGLLSPPAERSAA